MLGGHGQQDSVQHEGISECHQTAAFNDEETPGDTGLFPCCHTRRSAFSESFWCWWRNWPPHLSCPARVSGYEHPSIPPTVPAPSKNCEWWAFGRGNREGFNEPTSSTSASGTKSLSPLSFQRAVSSGPAVPKGPNSERHPMDFDIVMFWVLSSADSNLQPGPSQNSQWPLHLRLKLHSAHRRMCLSTTAEGVRAVTSTRTHFTFLPALCDSTRLSRPPPTRSPSRT